MSLVLKRLTDVDSDDIIELMNQPLLRRHMPLLSTPFTEADCEAFVAGKEQLWADHGYGPWAFVKNGELAGWGGLQPEGREADLALVLHPKHWGLGREICERVVTDGFERMGLDSVIVLLPPTRRRDRVMSRLGFALEGEVSLHGERFLRYRLHAPTKRGPPAQAEAAPSLHPGLAGIG